MNLPAIVWGGIGFEERLPTCDWFRIGVKSGAQRVMVAFNFLLTIKSERAVCEFCKMFFLSFVICVYFSFQIVASPHAPASVAINAVLPRDNAV